jgi:hypothetical protein
VEPGQDPPIPNVDIGALLTRLKNSMGGDAALAAALDAAIAAYDDVILEFQWDGTLPGVRAERCWRPCRRCPASWPLDARACLLVHRNADTVSLWWLLDWRLMP